ncbi:MAG: hypothetical protein ABI758_01775 [Candidatus Woesebacteria bacterium]
MTEAESSRLISLSDFTQRVKEFRPKDVSEQEFLATAFLLRGFLNQLLLESLSDEQYDTNTEKLMDKYGWLRWKHGATSSDVRQAINLTAQGKPLQFAKVHGSFTGHNK